MDAYTYGDSGHVKPGKTGSRLATLLWITDNCAGQLVLVPFGLQRQPAPVTRTRPKMVDRPPRQAAVPARSRVYLPVAGPDLAVAGNKAYTKR
jgi:hypothetical protein